jgi:hypothetical protein
MMTDTDNTITDDNVRAIASAALKADATTAAQVVDHWEVGTDVWLVNFRYDFEGRAGQRRWLTLTVMPSLAGGYAVAWYSPWGEARFHHIRTEEVS